MNASERFRAAVRRERERRGLNRKEMGDLVGKQRQWIAYIEDKATGVSLSTVDDFARALEMDPAALLLAPQNDFDGERRVREYTPEEQAHRASLGSLADWFPPYPEFALVCHAGSAPTDHAAGCGRVGDLGYLEVWECERRCPAAMRAHAMLLARNEKGLTFGPRLYTTIPADALENGE